ncbi:MAG TPA: DUF2508 family protein [Sedimentibacter sp.]|nr:DUF2508 family protein [Sedimentibacter sp.]
MKFSNLLLKIQRLLTIRDKDEDMLFSQEDEARKLVEGLEDAKRELFHAVRGFEYASDQEIIDYCTYKIKACQIKYGYLLKEAKRRGIRIPSSMKSDMKNNMSIM